MKAFRMSLWEWVRVNCHCLAELIGAWHPDHQVCSHSCFGTRTRYFCSCGYLNGGETWKQFLERMYRAENE